MNILHEIRAKISNGHFEFSAITLYEPDPSKWVGFRERRSRDA